MPGGFERLLGEAPAAPPPTPPGSPAGTGNGFNRLLGQTTTIAPPQRTSSPEDMIPDIAGARTLYRAATKTNPAYVAQEGVQGVVDLAAALPVALVDTMDYAVDRTMANVKKVRTGMTPEPYQGGPAGKFVEETVRPALGNSIKPENEYDKVIGNTMRLLTNNVVGAFGVRALATRFVRRGGDTTSRLGSLLGDIAKTDPKKLAAVESAWAAAAGSAGGAAEHYTDSRTAALYTELAMLVGGPAALDIVSNLATAFSNRELFRRLNDEQIKRIAAGTLQQVAAKDPRFIERLEGWSRVVDELGLDPDAIRGLQPDAGAISGDPGLQALADQARQRGFLQGDEAARSERFDEVLGAQAGRRVQGDPGDLRAAGGAAEGQTRARVEGALREPTEEVAAAVANKAETELAAKFNADTMAEAFDNAVRQADADALKELEKLGPQVDAYTAGRVFQDSFDAQDTLLSEAVQPAYARFAKELSGEQVSTQGVLREVERMIGETDPIAGAGNVPQEAMNILKDEEWTQGATTFERMVKVRRNLIKEITAAKGREGASPELVRNLTGLRQSIDESLSAFEPSHPVQGWREVNDFYRRGRERLDQGRLARMTQPGRHGEPMKMYPSEVAKDFVRADSQTGAKERLDEFLRATGGQAGIEPRVFTKTARPGDTRLDTPAVPGILPDPIAREAMDEFMVNEMANYATDPVKGFDRTRAQKWIREHKVQLDALPGLREKMTKMDSSITDIDARVESLKATVEKAKVDMSAKVKGAEERYALARDSLAEAQKVAKQTMEDFEKSALASVLKADPGREIDEIVSAPNRVQRVKELRKQLAGDEAAWRGAQKAVWERMLSDTKGGRSTPSRSLMFDDIKVRELLEKNGDVIDAVWGDAAPAQKQFLAALANATGANAVGAVPGTTGMGSKVLGFKTFDNLNHLVSAMTSRVYAFQRGVVSGRYLVTESILRIIGNQTTRMNDAAIDRLLMDALTDPKVALEMLRATAPKSPEGLNKALNTAIYTWQQRYQDEKQGPETRK